MTSHGIRAKELEALLGAIDWPALAQLGSSYRSQRLALLEWACHKMAEMARTHPKERIRQLALSLPMRLPTATDTTLVASR